MVLNAYCLGKTYISMSVSIVIFPSLTSDIVPCQNISDRGLAYTGVHKATCTLNSYAH